MQCRRPSSSRTAGVGPCIIIFPSRDASSVIEQNVDCIDKSSRLRAGGIQCTVVFSSKDLSGLVNDIGDVVGVGTWVRRVQWDGRLEVAPSSCALAALPSEGRRIGFRSQRTERSIDQGRATS